MSFRGSILVCAFVWLWASCAQALTVDVRLMCQATGGCGPGDFFIDQPEALTALQFAVKAFEPFADSLSTIPASPAWTASFSDPDTGNGTTLSNLNIPANTLVLYAGGYDMPGNQVGEAGPGLGTVSLSRGQGTVIGASAFDFATWGGSIAFDTLNNGSPRNWHFGIDTQPAPGQVDFLTIAFHELAHVFGFGTAPSFDNLITNHRFDGVSAISLTGAGVSLTIDDNHWASGTSNPVILGEQATAMTASLFLGRRQVFTPLDYAALKDLGWQVPNKLLGLHGDMDGDGDVDGRDFLAWQQGVGDADGNLMTNYYDLWLWRHNNGRRLAAGLLSASVQVPEPNGLALGFVAILFYGCYRKPTVSGRYRLT
jgi:hypothetical protein